MVVVIIFPVILQTDYKVTSDETHTSVKNMQLWNAKALICSLYSCPVHWWKRVATFQWKANDCWQSLWHCDCWLNTFYTSHCQLSDMVWSLRQVEVWPSTEE